MMGFGLAFSFIPVSIAALAGVAERESGLASGLLNTSQQVGGAVGVAVASTIAATHTTSLLRNGVSTPMALTSGFSWAFWLLAGLAAAGVIATVALMRRQELVAEPAPAPATAR